MTPRPFLKWAGGKTQLLQRLLARFPRAFGRYWEPFVGGGAVFFALRPERATLADINAELVEAYRVVQDDVEALIRELDGLSWDRETFYRVRAIDPADLTAVGRAARTVYLNRSCFNGLWRVNALGRFNVPFGQNRPPGARLAALLRAASGALGGTRLVAGTAFSLLPVARPGDLVYLDPPYHPASASASFTAYSRPPSSASPSAACTSFYPTRTRRLSASSTGAVASSPCARAAPSAAAARGAARWGSS